MGKSYCLPLKLSKRILNLTSLRIYISWLGNSPPGCREPEQEPDSVNNRLLSVSFSLAHIYLFGMKTGSSALIVKTNTISTNAAYVPTAVGRWRMSCKQCQHLLLRGCETHNPSGVRDFQSQSLHPTNYNALCGSGSILTFINLFSDCLYIVLFIHNFTTGIELCLAKCSGYVE